MQVLVTGAAGFIGAALAEALVTRGDRVTGIDNLNSYYDPKLKHARLERVAAMAEDAPGSFAFHRLDFADSVSLTVALEEAPFDAIVHLGAQAGVRHSIDNPASYVHSNLVGHANMLELARRREIGHFVYASSSSVYGGNEKLPFSVDDRADHPVSLYAATKRADEMMSEAYAHLYRVPMTGLRFFTVYGPWGRPDMAAWLFTEAILKGERIRVFNEGEMWRDFTYIDDIVAGVLACIDNPPADDGAPKAGGSTKAHALYNIGNHRSEKLTRVIELIEDACGRKAEVELLPMQPGDVARTYADIDAIQRDLAYQPTTRIEDGIPKVVEGDRAYHGV